MERVILSYPRKREGFKIVVFGIPGMLLIGFKNKRENLVKFGPIIALTLCILIIHANLNWGFTEKHPIIVLSLMVHPRPVCLL